MEEKLYALSVVKVKGPKKRQKDRLYRFKAMRAKLPKGFIRIYRNMVEKLKMARTMENCNTSIINMLDKVTFFN